MTDSQKSDGARGRSRVQRGPVLKPTGAFAPLLHFFAAPFFPDNEEKTRRAALLYTFLISAILLIFCENLIVAPFAYTRKLIHGLIGLGLLGFLSLAYWLMCRGHLTTTAILYLASSSAAITAYILFSRGLVSVLLVFYIVTTVIAGLLYLFFRRVMFSRD